MMEHATEKTPSIPELFDGKSILVTGATGFLGKVLIEKLLRSCTGIKEILVLLRPLHDGDEEIPADVRLNELKENDIFKKLRRKQPNPLDKLKALSGRIELDNLGLDGKDLCKITSHVSFIFHCAANVRFEDKPSKTLNANLLGVKNVLDVCRLCTCLQAFVHTSTAYAYTHLPEISEIVYPELVNPEHMIEILGWMSNEQLHCICEEYMQDRQSLYQLSKALAENLIVNYEADVPAIIVRPSIVTAAVKEPFPGWIDNQNGPTGFIVVCGKSVVKTLLVDPEVNADWVPVDIVTNTLIVAAHYVAVTSKLKSWKLNAPSRVPVINCTCPPSNAITWMKIIDICIPYLMKYPSEHLYGKPGGTVTASRFRYSMCRLISHHIPAYFTDGLLYLLRKKPVMRKMYRMIHGVMRHLEHYTTHSYVFNSPNMQELVRRMDPADAEIFPIDQSVLDWNQYIENYVHGTRLYFLQESDATLPEARMRMMRLHYLNKVVKTTSVMGILLLCYAFKKHLPCFSILPKFSFEFLPLIALLQKKFQH